MPRTIIIGAGAAGLAAAQRLIKSGYKEVLVLEATDKIGGRVCSVSASYQSEKTTPEERHHTLELGAQWVHGRVGNIAYELASREGLIEEVDGSDEENEDMSGFDSTTFVMDDNSADNEIDNVAMTELVEAINARAKSFKNSSSASRADFFNENFEELIKHRDEDFRIKARIFRDFYHRLMRSIEGCNHWKDSSFNGMVFRYKDCPGPALIPYKTESKYLDLLEVLARGKSPLAFIIFIVPTSMKPYSSYQLKNRPLMK